MTDLVQAGPMKPGQVDFEGLRCEEASIHSRETFIACGAPGEAVVRHEHDGRKNYIMCWPCAWHNVKNRRGKLIAVTGDKKI